MKSVSLLAIIAVCSTAPADMATERWGEGPCRHTGKAVSSAASGGGWIIKYDLSDLPKGAKIVRARFLPYVRPTGSPSISTPPRAGRRPCRWTNSNAWGCRWPGKSSAQP